MSFLLLIFTVLCFLSVVSAFAIRSQNAVGCEISINDKKQLSEPQPLILKLNLKQKHAFYYPNNTNGNIIFEKGQKILLSCPGKNNYFNSTDWKNRSKRTEEIVSCTDNNQFSDGKKNYKFNEFTCKSYPYHQVKRTNKKCYKENLEFHIGFQVNRTFVKLIDICYDDQLMSTLYISFNMTPSVREAQSGFPRPTFIESIFFNQTKRKVNKLYTRSQQEKIISVLLNSTQLAEKYVHNNNSFFLARGHLAAKADFVFAAQQRATFYFVNVAPQWQSFNAGNWLNLERSIRKFSSDRNMELQIYTGVFNVTTLSTIDGQQIPIYLFAQNGRYGIPVPKYFWKVVYNTEKLQGIAFIGINNPYEFNTTDVFCDSICDQIKWINNWNQKNVSVGYTFCCDVNEFRKTVTYLPKFEIIDFLY